MTEEDTRQAVFEEARRHPGQEQMVLEYFQKNPQAMQQISGPIFEDKVVDFILEMARVTDVKIDTETLYQVPDETGNGKNLAKKSAAKKSASKKSVAKKSAAVHIEKIGGEKIEKIGSKEARGKKAQKRSQPIRNKLMAAGSPSVQPKNIRFGSAHQNNNMLC